MGTHVQGRAGQTINFKGTLLYNGVEVGSKTISDNFKIGDPDAPANGSTAYTLPDEFEGQAIEIFASDLGRFLIAGEDYTRNGMASQGLELTLLNGNQFLTGGYWNISGGKAIDGAQEVLDEAKAYTDDKFDALAGGQLPVSPTDEPTTGVYIYNVKEAGTYTNFGGLVVTTDDLEEGQVQLWLTDGVWSKEIIPIDLAAYLKKSDVNYNKIIGKNKFDKLAILNGFSLNPSGVVTPSATSAISDYIPVSATTKYTISGRSGNAGIAYYDADKSWISDVFTPMNGTITTPSNTAFIRMNVVFEGVGSLNTTQIELGEVATAYAEYESYDYTSEILETPLAASYIKDIDNIAMPPEQYMIEKGFGKTETITYTSKNLFDKTAVTLGSLNGSGGAFVPSATSRISDYIPVTSGSYVISGRSGNQTLVTYDENKVPTPVGGNFGAGALNGVYTFGAGVAFVRFIAVFSGTGNLDTIQFERGSTATPYEPYKKEIFVSSINGNKILGVDKTAVFSNQAVLYNNGSLVIISKYDYSRKTKTVFTTALANSFFCIGTQHLISDSGGIDLNSFYAPNSKSILSGLSTDLIGPYILFDTGFVSGNHTATYLGTPRRTARMLSKKIFVDGVEISESETVYDTKEIKVVVETEVFNYNQIITDGTEIVDFKEYHTYTVIDGKIDCVIQCVAVRACTFTRLYGIQNVLTADINRIYVAHSAITGIQVFNNTANYGTKGTYPNVEKAIFTDSSTSDSLNVWLDRTKGLGSDVRTSPTSAAYLVATTKGYHVQILNSSLSLAVGESFFYHGGYAPFKNLSNTANVIAYTQFDAMDGKTYLFVDFASTSPITALIQVPEFIGKSLEVTAKDPTITLSDSVILGAGLRISSTGYGNAKILIK